jgi:hypothetical protein
MEDVTNGVKGWLFKLIVTHGARHKLFQVLLLTWVKALEMMCSSCPCRFRGLVSAPSVFHDIKIPLHPEKFKLSGNRSNLEDRDECVGRPGPRCRSPQLPGTV